VARTVREGIGAGHVVVAIGEAVEAEEGQPGPQPAQWFTVTHQGDDVGAIGVAPRPGEAALTAQDRAALQRLAGSAAASMHAVASYRRLQAAREALVLAREEERRRLRRDLHDDLAPTLAGLSMKASATAQVMPRDPERAAAMLTDLTTGLTAALTQVREISLDLRPPILDDEGLVAAVRERVGAAAGDPPVVEVIDEVGDDTMPAAVELAALRIAQEAVKNVRTHAAATQCTVKLTRTPDALTVRVADDGVGLRPDARRGVGLRSIEERAAELGGRLELASGSGGTTLEVLLPCRGGSS
jgi:signal transduction histidine kinase